MRRFVARRCQRRPLALLAGSLLLMIGPPFTAWAANLADTVEKIKASVVAVGTVQPARRPPAKFQASGFVVGRGRQVITNAHVLPAFLDSQNNEALAVFIGQGTQVESRRAKKIAIDSEHDLALLEIEGQPLPALRLGGSQRPREGQAIAFTGFPIGVVLGLFPVTHQGIISAISPVAIPVPAAGNLDAATIRRLKNEPYEVLQLDATAYPGNSGSPLYEPDTGQVIGVINKVFVQESKESILEKPSGITYAVPVRYVQALLKRAESSKN